MRRAPKSHVIPGAGMAVVLLFRFLAPAGSEELLVPEMLRADELIGYAVIDDNRTPLGYVVDLVIRADGGVPYFIAQFEDDFFGSGIRHGSYLIPMDVCRIDRNTGTLLLEGIDRTRLEDYPGILGNEPDAVSERDWSGFSSWWRQENGLELDTDTDTEGYGFREFTGPEFIEGVLASDLRGFKVFCREGLEVGSVAGIMLRVPETRVVYVALRIGDQPEGGLLNGDLPDGREKLIAVPPDRISIDTRRMLLSVDFDRDALERMEGFEEEWPEQPDPALAD